MGTFTKLYPQRAGETAEEPSAAILQKARLGIAAVKPAPSPSLVLSKPEQATAALSTIDQARRSARDVDSALGMLQRAASAFEFVSQKLDETEQSRDSALRHIEEQARAASQFQQIIEVMKNRISEVESESAEIARRLQAEAARASAAEERSAFLENAVRSAERQMSDMEHSFSRLHDSVMSTFGHGSFTERAVAALTDDSAVKAA